MLRAGLGRNYRGLAGSVAERVSAGPKPPPGYNFG